MVELVEGYTIPYENGALAMILCNVGGIKSGSTWLGNIINQLARPKEFWKVYNLTSQTRLSKLPEAERLDICVKKSLLGEYLEDLYYLKLHAKPTPLLLETINDNILFFITIRDPRDAFISFFYHMGHEVEFDNFDNFFMQKHESFLKNYASYNKAWLIIDRRFLVVFNWF